MSTITNNPVVALADERKTSRFGEVDVPAVRGVIVEIPRQRFSVIVAPSESGKTTFLNLMGCLNTPTAGQVTVAGQDVAARSDNAPSDCRAQKIGCVVQNVSVIPICSAYEHRAEKQP